MNKLSAAAAVVVAAALSLSGAGAANAEETPRNDAAFIEVVEALGLTFDVQAEIEARFDALPNTEQDAILAQAETDPASLVQFSEPVRSVTVADGGGVSARAAVKSYLAKDVVNGTFLGVTVGSFTNEFKYNANTSNVTSILSCKGWFSGFGLSGSTNASQYISNTGRGTCDVVHNLSFVIKGSPVTFNKQHTITTNSGSPVGYKATLKTV